MEMTLNFLRNQNSKMMLTSLVMPIGILALITMMVLPVPVFMLDIFFVGNILVSLLILMVAIKFLMYYLPIEYLLNVGLLRNLIISSFWAPSSGSF